MVKLIENHDEDHQRGMFDPNLHMLGMVSPLKWEKNRRKIAENFENNLMDLEEDPALKNLIKHSFNNRDGKAGPLNQMLLDLRTFEKAFLGKNKDEFENVKAQSEFLNRVYIETMDRVVRLYPQLQSMGGDWNAMHVAVHSHMLKFAEMFHLEGAMKTAMNHWDSVYRRDLLNQQALAKHQAAAYHSAAGSDMKIIAQVQHEIRQIDEQLDRLELPADEDAPAFSKYNRKYNIQFSNPVVTYPGDRYHELKPDERLNKQTPQKAPEVKPEQTGWRKWAKKVPLVGKWF